MITNAITLKLNLIFVLRLMITMQKTQISRTIEAIAIAAILKWRSCMLLAGPLLVGSLLADSLLLAGSCSEVESTIYFIILNLY